MNLPLFLIFSFAASIIGTIAGFGSATILTPIAGLFMDFKVAIVVVAFFHLFGNLSRVGLFRGNIDWKLFFQFGVPSILFAFVGATISIGLTSHLIKGIFGAFLILYVLLSFAMPKFRLTPSIKTSIVGGVSSGFVAGMIGTGGAIRAGFLSSFHLEKERYIATSAMIALVMDVTRIPIYIAGGALTNQPMNTYIVIFALIGSAYFGAKIGKSIVKKISRQHFQRFVFAVLFLAGTKFVWDTIKGYL